MNLRTYCRLEGERFKGIVLKRKGGMVPTRTTQVENIGVWCGTTSEKSSLQPNTSSSRLATPIYSDGYSGN